MSLIARIRREIRERGPISFARFMECALYDPRGGYYAGGGGRIGTAGDFYTASDVGRDFGAALARQLLQIDRAVGPLDPFHVVEFGPGRGLLARDVIDAAAGLDPDFAARLRYVLVDRSRAMRDEARSRVPEAEALDPSEIGDGHRGCVVAVEVFDALPVHRLRRTRGELRELYVDVDDHGALVEVERPCTDAARSLAERFGAAATDGSEAEVAPGAAELLGAMDRCLERGVMLIVDYGERAEALYDATRPEGTLLAYRRHATHRDYLEHVGEQDLTAHVNLSAIEHDARELGLEMLGLTTQDRFLIANGLLEAFDDDASGGVPDAARVKRRLQAMQLIHPEGMGRRFKVLALGKRCRPGLDGLNDPFA